MNLNLTTFTNKNRETMEMKKKPIYGETNSLTYIFNIFIDFSKEKQNNNYYYDIQNIFLKKNHLTNNIINYFGCHIIYGIKNKTKILKKDRFIL